jgi:hypothetical protein
MTDLCPNCGKLLIYDHYTDSMKCLFCNYRHNVAIPTHIEDDTTNSTDFDSNRFELDNWEKTDAELNYSEDDDVDYGNYVEG